MPGYCAAVDDELVVGFATGFISNGYAKVRVVKQTQRVFLLKSTS